MNQSCTKVTSANKELYCVIWISLQLKNLTWAVYSTSVHVPVSVRFDVLSNDTLKNHHVKQCHTYRICSQCDSAWDKCRRKLHQTIEVERFFFFLTLEKKILTQHQLRL